MKTCATKVWGNVYSANNSPNITRIVNWYLPDSMPWINAKNGYFPISGITDKPSSTGITTCTIRQTTTTRQAFISGRTWNCSPMPWDWNISRTSGTTTKPSSTSLFPQPSDRPNWSRHWLNKSTRNGKIHTRTRPSSFATKAYSPRSYTPFPTRSTKSTSRWGTRHRTRLLPPWLPCWEI